jgi:hypothetical protein
LIHKLGFGLAIQDFHPTLEVKNTTSKRKEIVKKDKSIEENENPHVSICQILR